jgi:hypothetical protein
MWDNINNQWACGKNPVTWQNYNLNILADASPGIANNLTPVPSLFRFGSSGVFIQSGNIEGYPLPFWDTMSSDDGFNYTLTSISYTKNSPSYGASYKIEMDITYDNRVANIIGFAIFKNAVEISRMYGGVNNASMSTITPIVFGDSISIRAFDTTSTPGFVPRSMSISISPVSFPCFIPSPA